MNSNILRHKYSKAFIVQKGIVNFFSVDEL